MTHQVSCEAVEIYNLIAQETLAVTVAHVFGTLLGEVVWMFGTIVESLSKVIERKGLAASAPFSDVHGESKCELLNLGHVSDLSKSTVVVGIVDGINHGVQEISWILVDCRDVPKCG